MKNYVIIIILVCFILSGCKNQFESTPNIEEELGTTLVAETEITESQIDLTQNTSEMVVENLDKHYLTIEDIINCSLYRPDLTEQMALDEGFNLIESTSGRIYEKDGCEYVFYNWSVNPIATNIKATSENYSIMGIGVNDTFDEALSKLPNDFKWNDNPDNLIYGRMPNNSDIEYPYHGNAYIDNNGNGTITLVPSENYPFVQYIVKDNEIIKITILYYEL